MTTAEWVEELIARAERALREAEGHGETVLVALCRDKITALQLLREQIPDQRQPDHSPTPQRGD